MAIGRTTALVLWTACCIGSGCGSSGARPSFERFDLSVTPAAADYPDVSAVVLVDRGLLTFGIDDERNVPFARVRRYRRVKVLRPEGRALAEVVVPYDPGAIVRGLMGRAVFPDGRSIEIDDGDDVQHARGLRARRLVLPDVDVGTVIEYTYDVFTDDLRFLPAWAFQNRNPTIRSEFAVVVPEGFEVDLRFSREGRFVDQPPERFVVETGTRYSWSMSDLPPRFPEANMPSPALLSPRAHVLFRSARLGTRTVQGFQSWDDVARWHLQRVAQWDELSEATVREARRVVGESSPDEGALKLTEVLARDLPPRPGLQPPLWRTTLEHPDTVLASRESDPSSRGMLLVALLRAVGVPAVPALVAYSDRDVLVPDAPTVRAVDAVVAVVPRSFGPLVLDPGQLTLSTQVASPRLQQSRIVLLRPEGAEVIRVPRSSPDDSRCEVDFRVRLIPRGDIVGRVDARMTGAEAGLLRQQLLDSAPDAYARVVSEFLRDRGLALPIESLVIADLRALRRPLSFKARVLLPAAVKSRPGSVFVRLGTILGGPEGPIRQTRRSPLLLGAPSSVEIRGSLQLPEGYQPDVLPPPARHTFSDIEVSLQIRAETPRRLGFLRWARRKATKIPSRAYPAYARFLEQVRASEDQAFSIVVPTDPSLIED